MLECKACIEQRKHIEYLQGLLDRTMQLIAPVVSSEFQGDNKESSEKREDIKYGDG